MEFGFGFHTQSPISDPASMRTVAVRGEELGWVWVWYGVRREVFTVH